MSQIIDRKFAQMGARAKIHGPGRRQTGPVRLDVLRDRQGEFFDIRVDGESQPEVSILDVQPKDRHLLLLVRTPVERKGGGTD